MIDIVTVVDILELVLIVLIVEPLKRLRVLKALQLFRLPLNGGPVLEHFHLLLYLLLNPQEFSCAALVSV